MSAGGQHVAGDATSRGQVDSMRHQKHLASRNPSPPPASPTPPHPPPHPPTPPTQQGPRGAAAPHLAMARPHGRRCACTGGLRWGGRGRVGCEEADRAGGAVSGAEEPSVGGLGLGLGWGWGWWGWGWGSGMVEWGFKGWWGWVSGVGRWGFKGLLGLRRGLGGSAGLLHLA